MFISNKPFDWCKYSLAWPPSELFDLCCAIERILQANLECVVAGPGVMGRVKSNTQATGSTVVIINFFAFTFITFVKIRNSELKELAEKKKATQVSNDASQFGRPHKLSIYRRYQHHVEYLHGV
jgi:DhnA family fructose-bisphosphate aldolase class Ia